MTMRSIPERRFATRAAGVGFLNSFGLQQQEASVQHGRLSFSFPLYSKSRLSLSYHKVYMACQRLYALKMAWRKLCPLFLTIVLVCAQK